MQVKNKFNLPKLTVVIPTFNEAGNISIIVEKIEATLLSKDFEVLFVDDNSDDGTIEAIKMLEEAYSQKSDDPYIIDSIGWAYYLINDFNKAENFLIRAVQLMPDDPIVIDHYGDILWKLNRKIQARYFWLMVLDMDDAEQKLKDNIENKLIDGPKNS